MDLFTSVFLLLVVDFSLAVFFIAKLFSNLDHLKLGKYKYLGPIVFFVPGIMNKAGYYYLAGVLASGALFFLGFGYLSSIAKPA